jgi:hypothetical protein
MRLITSARGRYITSDLPLATYPNHWSAVEDQLSQKSLSADGVFTHKSLTPSDRLSHHIAPLRVALAPALVSPHRTSRRALAGAQERISVAVLRPVHRTILAMHTRAGAAVRADAARERGRGRGRATTARAGGFA